MELTPEQEAQLAREDAIKREGLKRANAIADMRERFSRQRGEPKHLNAVLVAADALLSDYETRDEVPEIAAVAPDIFAAAYARLQELANAPAPE